MIGYLVPIALAACMFMSVELITQQLLLALLAGLALVLVVPLGDLHGKPLIVRLVDLPNEIRRRKRKGFRRHRYS